MNFQLTLNGNAVANMGGFLTTKERIYKLFPAKGWEQGGQWIGDPLFLKVDQNGLVADVKAYISDPNPNLGLGKLLFQYTQTLGVLYKNWCGNVQVSSIGQVTVSQSRSATHANRWMLKITKS